MVIMIHYDMYIFPHGDHEVLFHMVMFDFCFILELCVMTHVLNVMTVYK